MNPRFNYLPVGILADDSLLTGRRIHGIEVLGTFSEIGKILKERAINGVIITEYLDSIEQLNSVKEICKANQCWIKVLRLGFEDL